MKIPSSSNLSAFPWSHLPNTSPTPVCLPNKRWFCFILFFLPEGNNWRLSGIDQPFLDLWVEKSPLVLRPESKLPLDFLQAIPIWGHDTPVPCVVERKEGSPKRG